MTRSITMTILVTGSTGVIGSQVVANLAEKGAEVHALTRSPEKTKFPRGVTPVKGDLMDIDATQAAIAKTSTLFLLNAVTPDELTQALLTLSLARGRHQAHRVLLGVPQRRLHRRSAFHRQIYGRAHDRRL
jgi:uncharacterized protein YbjT (DUF2867 family)